MLSDEVANVRQIWANKWRKLARTPVRVEKLFSEICKN